VKTEALISIDIEASLKQFGGQGEEYSGRQKPANHRPEITGERIEMVLAPARTTVKVHFVCQSHEIISRQSRF